RGDVYGRRKSNKASVDRPGVPCETVGLQDVTSRRWSCFHRTLTNLSCCFHPTLASSSCCVKVATPDTMPCVPDWTVMFRDRSTIPFACRDIYTHPPAHLT
ncbi:unnamed protein product, partial [Ectocarpus sp. 12 AP-2014]